MKLRRGYKRAKRWLVFQLLRGLLAPLGWLPERWAFALGRLVGRVAFVVAVGPRRRAIAQLQAALEVSPETARQLAKEMFRHLGLTIAEMILVRRDPARVERWVPLEDHPREVLDRVLAQGGVIGVTAHLGNWELIPQRLGRAGYPLIAAARENPNAYLDRWLVELRSAAGVRTLHRGDTAGLLELRRALRQRSLFAALIDQDIRARSCFVPFFGRPAATVTAPAELALRLRLPVVVAAIQRTPSGRHKLMIEELPLDGLPEEPEARVVALTERMSAALEAWIRGAPEQWVWFHARWRSRPSNAA